MEGQVLVQPVAAWLLRSLRTGQCPRRGEAGWGLPQAGGQSLAAGRCWDTRCPTVQVQGARGTQLGSANLSAVNIRRKRTEHTASPICVHTHTLSLVHPDEGNEDPEVEACSPFTLCSVVLIFASPFHASVFCQPYHPPPPKPQQFFS